MVAACWSMEAATCFKGAATWSTYAACWSMEAASCCKEAATWSMVAACWSMKMIRRSRKMAGRDRGSALRESRTVGPVLLNLWGIACVKARGPRAWVINSK